MDESTKTSPCKECKEGDSEVDLQAEVDHLRQHLAERDSHIVILEGEFLKCSVKANDLDEQVSTWREKYERLYDSHKRVQKLNQVLEDKLLQMVDKMKGEKSQLTKDIATLSVRLAESKHSVSMLQKENERYKNDMNLAIQLLQCKPDNFVSQKLDNLPVDTQTRVSHFVMSKTKPTTPTQSKNGNDNEILDTNEYEFNISASLMSKILEDSIQDTVTKHCDTCTCNKAKNKPFSYNETHYSISTQTLYSGEMKNSLCLNCNAEVKSAHSNISVGSVSPHNIKLVNDRSVNTSMLASSMYLLAQSVPENTNKEKKFESKFNINSTNDKSELRKEQSVKIEKEKLTDLIAKEEDDVKHLRKSVNLEPGVHHKLCERTRTSVPSIKGSENGNVTNDIISKDNEPTKDAMSKYENAIIDNISVRKNSLGSMGAISRTSSIAKSTSSTHKSNTQVGPGPRFCSLRMQAGSKNILLDNAQPDVPPVLYKRQSKCTENSIFKELNDVDNFIDLEKTDINCDDKNDNVVIESTLVDVFVDNNNKDTSSKNSSMNPVLMNVSSSPLQPLKTHSLSNGSERNNSSVNNNLCPKSIPPVDTLLNDFKEDNHTTTDLKNELIDTTVDTETSKINNEDVQIFNFDRYEQNKLSNPYAKIVRRIGMAQFHTIGNTKISKDLPPQGKFPNLSKKFNGPPKQSFPAVVNVYPNLTQTHLKVNDNKKIFTNEKSTSSLSSDDSAAVLQKQQLLRVAEWVEQNLEQQNNLNDPLTLEDDMSFANKLLRRDSKLHQVADNLETALKMPHPVSKYSKASNEEGNSWLIHNNKTDNENPKIDILNNKVHMNNVTKETEFPADNSDSNTTTEIKADKAKNHVDSMHSVVENNLNDILNTNGDNGITAEELARMEYNVKKFLLSGANWGQAQAEGRSTRTSSKTETDV